MIGHRRVRRRLYDYLEGALPPASRARIDGHLMRCARCHEELEHLRTAIGLLSSGSRRPSDARGEEFWALFPDRVMTEISRRRPVRRVPVLGILRSWLASPGRRTAMAGAAAVLLLALLVPPAIVREPEPAPGRSEDIDRYFRRSRVLLVGLDNMKPGESPDLTLEQEISRELIRQASAIREEDLDRYSADVARNLRSVLTELAERRPAPPDVDLIRGDIRRSNLLFRLRMAEAMYDSARFITVDDRRMP